MSSKILPIVPSPVVRHYRNKIEFSFGWCDAQKHDQVVAGFHRQGRWEALVDVDHCWIAAERANEIYEYLKPLILNS